MKISKIAKKSIALVSILVIVVVVIIISIYYSSQNTIPKIGREEALIESKGLAEFDPQNNTINTVTPHAKEVAETMLPIIKSMGDGKDNTKNEEAINLLSGAIRKYPTYSDAYFLRATISVLTNKGDYQNILSDIDNAIKFSSSTDYQNSSSVQSMYALRAKVDILSGNDQQAIVDLNTAITIDPTKITDIFNTGGVKPSDTSNPTALQQADFDALVAQYPNDYRTYIFRGLFYNSFSFYDNQYYKPAVDDLKKAISINSNSALPLYFLGTVYEKAATWIYSFKINGGTSAYDSARDSLNSQALNSFNQAIKLDPNFKEAIAAVAESYYELKQYSQAIPYYDQVIAIDPNDAGAYNDRGLAKFSTNDYFGAISDFSEAIRLKQADQSSLQDSYDNRANAYIKSGDYDSAIEDFSNEIGLKFASQVFLMSLSQIRSIYPEFSNISDADLLEGLRQKYFPSMTSVDFVGQYQKNTKPYEDFILAGLYVSRGDAYLSKGNFKKAAGEYNRAIHDDSTVNIDRWKTISSTADTQYSVDTQTFDFSQGNVVSLWLKTLNINSGNYTQQNYQIECTERQIKSLSATSYDSQGNVTNSSTAAQSWQSIIPESIGEVLHNDMCPQSI